MNNCLTIRCFLKTFVTSLIFIYGFIQPISCQMSDNMAKMQAVKDKILRNYDRTIRPTVEGSNTTEIDTGFIPRQILQLDEETAMFTLDSFLWMSWEDSRLRWNTSDFDGYLQLPTSLLWVPDITVYNSHSQQVDPTQHVLTVIHNSGRIYWAPPILTQTSCPIVSQTPYPYDEVECIIKLGSWSHDGWEINFGHSEELYMSEFENIHPRWELITSKTIVKINVTQYECCPEPYISIHVHFPMKRRPVPEIEATRVPCILVMLLTLSMFWLPPDSSKKFLLGGLLFIILCVLLVYVSWSTKHPLSVLFAVSFLQSTMYILVTAILFQVLIISKLCSLNGPSRPPPAAMQMISGPMGKYLCLRSPLSEDTVPLDRVQLKEDSVKDSPTPRDDWIQFAAALDRIFFFVVAIAMILVHHL